MSANPGITNPNLIFPGQVIQLPYGGRNDTERYEAIERPPFISGTQTGSTYQAPTNTGNIFNDAINWGLNEFRPFTQQPETRAALTDFLQGGGSPTSAPTANFTGGGSGGTSSGGGSTSTGGAGGGGTVTAEQAAKLGPGVVKFAVQTAAGIEERFVYFPPHVWQEIMASPMKDRWGLDQTFFESGFPEIPVARIEDFRSDINNFLSPTSRVEAMNVMQTVDYNAFNSKDIPPPPGFAWSTDPNTGERVPVDLQPLVGPPITSWHWNAETAQWVQVNDPTDIATSMFEGIPEAVRPWLQLALDNGGDASVVTDPVARRWVEYALDQHGESSMRPPVEQPFGTGVPNFGPGGVGSSINPPPFAVGGNLVVPPGTAAPGTTTPTNFAGAPLRPIITAAEIFGNRPVGADFAGVDVWQSSLDALMSGASVGASKDIFNQNTAAGEFYRSLRDKGLIDIIDQGQQLSPQEQAAHNAQRQAKGLPPINFNDNITIVWRESPAGSAWKPGYDPRYGVIPTPPSGQPGDMGGYMPGTVPNQPAFAPDVSAPAPPATTPQSAPPPAPTQLQEAYNAGQLPAGSAGARAYENLYGNPSAPPPAPWEQVYKDLVSKGYQLPGYAWGGITSDKMFRVGEDGPEIIYNPDERPLEVIPEKRIGKGGADPKGLKAQRFVMNEDDKSNRRPKTTIPAGGGLRFDKDRPLDTSQVVDSRPDPLEAILQDRLAQYTRDTGRVPTPFQIAEQRRIVQAEFANRETEMDRAFANQSVLGIPHAAPAASLIGGIMGEIDRFTGAPIRGAIKTPQNPLGGAFAGFMNPDYASGRDILGIDRLSDKDIIGSFSPRDIAGFGAEVVSDVGVAGGLLKGGARASDDVLEQIWPRMNLRQYEGLASPPSTVKPGMRTSEWARGRTWFHGSNVPQLQKEALTLDKASVGGDLPGVYFADNPTYSLEYTNGTGNLYNAKMGQMNLFDAEAPLADTPELLARLQENINAYNQTAQFGSVRLPQANETFDGWYESAIGMTDLGEAARITADTIKDNGYDGLIKTEIPMEGGTSNVLVLFEPGMRNNVESLRNISDQRGERGLLASLVPLPEGFMNKISQAGWKEIPLERTRNWDVSAWLSPKGEILSKRGAIHADINLDGGVWEDLATSPIMKSDAPDSVQYQSMFDAGWVRILGPDQFALGHPSGLRQIENLLIERPPKFPSKEYTIFMQGEDGAVRMANFTYEEFMQDNFKLRNTVNNALRRQFGGQPSPDATVGIGGGTGPQIYGMDRPSMTGTVGGGKIPLMHALDEWTTKGQMTPEARNFGQNFISYLPDKYVDELRMVMRDDANLIYGFNNNGPQYAAGLYWGTPNQAASPSFMALYNPIIELSGAAMKNKSNARAVVHEVGHHLETFLNDADRALLQNEFVRQAASSRRPGAYRFTNFEEWFAEQVADQGARILMEAGSNEARSVIRKAMAYLQALLRSVVDMYRNEGKNELANQIVRDFLNGVYQDKR